MFFNVVTWTMTVPALAKINTVYMRVLLLCEHVCQYVFTQRPRLCVETNHHDALIDRSVITMDEDFFHDDDEWVVSVSSTVCIRCGEVSQ